MLLEIEATFPIPKSWTNRVRQEAENGRVAHTSKPDWDNIGKIVSDALNGIALRDDSQVVRATVTKRYGATPQIMVAVRSLG